ALASIYPDSKKIEILRIPRDTYVYIPRINKMDKINHAYVWGGMGEKGIQSTIATVNQFVKYTKVDNYFAIDMEPVPDIIDKLGGVDLEVDVDMNTHGFNLLKGFQHLDGDKAYQFISWRYSGEGEIDRIRRQQKLLEAMFIKLKENMGLKTSVEIIMKYHSNIKTNMNLQQLFKIAQLTDRIEADKLEYTIIPGEGQMIDGIWYMVPDKEKTEIILKDYYQ
ncbi:MAG: cell envelope-related transcriptional attenuator, partial [Clostridiales bacterium]|nr:cell envelope-related transcriptional attenuator [Clostridiales bacterium]